VGFALFSNVFPRIADYNGHTAKPAQTSADGFEAVVLLVWVKTINVRLFCESTFVAFAQSVYMA
jgi:hypothetical protein